MLYENGWGVSKNLALAEYLYRTVVEKFGNGEFAEEAKTRLALMQANFIRGSVNGETKTDYRQRMLENLWGKKGN